jgi:hypothetical protein
MIGLVASAVAFAGVYGDTRTSRLLEPKRAMGRDYGLGIYYKQDSIPAYSSTNGSVSS